MGDAATSTNKINKFAEKFALIEEPIVAYVRKLLLAESSKEAPDYHSRLRVDLEFYSKKKLMVLASNFEGFPLSHEMWESPNKVYVLETFIEYFIEYLNKIEDAQ